MTSFFLAFVHPVPSLGPNNHGFQRVCGAGTMTGFVFFFFSTALESLKIPFFFPPETAHSSASKILHRWGTSLKNSSRRGNIL